MRRALLCVSLVAAAIGCSPGGLATDGAGGSTGTTGTTGTTTVAEDDLEGEVELLAAGAEPRVELRLHPEEGAEQSVQLRQATEFRFEAQGVSEGIVSPPTEFDIAYRVTRIDGDRIHVEVTYEDGRVDAHADEDPGLVEALEETVAALEGTTAMLVLDTRGRAVEADLPDVDLPSAGGPFAGEVFRDLERQANALSVAFPDEPVGVGARWRITTSLDIGGLRAELTQEVELTELDGDRVVGDVTVSIVFLPGPFEVPGGDARIDGGELSGGGTQTWDLSAIVAVGEQTAEGTVGFTVTAPGEGAIEVEQYQRQEVTVTLRGG